MTSLYIVNFLLYYGATVDSPEEETLLQKKPLVDSKFATSFVSNTSICLFSYLRHAISDNIKQAEQRDAHGFLIIRYKNATGNCIEISVTKARAVNPSG